MTSVDEHECDEIPMRPAPLKRCARRDCREPVRRTGAKSRPGGVLCRKHHAAAMKKWREKRRRSGALAARRPCASSSAEAVLARVQLHRKRRRGAVKPTICAACGKGQGVVAVHLHQEMSTAIVWACRSCRLPLLIGLDERRAAAERDAAERRERIANATRLATAFDAIESLPDAVAAALRDLASRGPAGIRLNAASPLYQLRLAALVEEFRERNPAFTQRLSSLGTDACRCESAFRAH